MSQELDQSEVFLDSHLAYIFKFWDSEPKFLSGLPYSLLAGKINSSVVMQKGLFHRNVFDAKAGLRLHVPIPPVNFTPRQTQGLCNTKGQPIVKTRRVFCKNNGWGVLVSPTIV